MSYDLEGGSVSDDDSDEEIEKGANASRSDSGFTNEIEEVSPVEIGKPTNKRKSNTISEDVKQHVWTKKKPSISDEIKL